MKNQKKITYTFIDDYEALISESEGLISENIIGVDLESDSLFHYKEKVCLLQISTESRNILIDPLAVKDLSPLAPVFSSRKITKVLHGSDYDIRSLYRDFSIEVNSLFDTQIAARLIGIRETGLANLLKFFFNATLQKKYQKKDWSKRPLPEAMLTYAVYDTNYLIPLSRILGSHLAEKVRTGWFMEECELLTGVRHSAQNEDPLFYKFKGARKLAPLNLAVLDRILRLREDIAEKTDRPPFKVLQNDQIMKAANKLPLTPEDIGFLSSRQARTMGRAIIRTVKEVMELPESELPVFPKNKIKPVETGTSGCIKVLKKWRQDTSHALDIELSLVCTNAQIQALSIASPKSIQSLKETGILKNWQAEMFAEELCSILNSTD